MVSLQDVREKHDDVFRIAAGHGARDVRVFGSIARGEGREDSDLDLLVKMDDDRSLLDHVALIRDLEELLGGKVDVIPEEALHRSIRDKVLREAVDI